jgi:hypothetical protein
MKDKTEKVKRATNTERAVKNEACGCPCGCGTSNKQNPKRIKN